MSTLDGYMRLSKAAAYLDMGKTTFRSHVAEGLIDFTTTKGGHKRFRREWLDEYMEGRKHISLLTKIRRASLGKVR